MRRLPTRQGRREVEVPGELVDCDERHLDGIAERELGGHGRDDRRTSKLYDDALLVAVDDERCELLADAGKENDTLDRVDNGAIDCMLPTRGHLHGVNELVERGDGPIGWLRVRTVRDHDLVGIAISEPAQGRGDVRVGSGDSGVHGHGSITIRVRCIELGVAGAA